MRSTRWFLLAPFALLALGACGSGDTDADSERDLNLPPAESIATLGDTALGEPEQPEEPAAPRARPVPPPALDEGTSIMLSASETVELNDDAVGSMIMATAVEGLYDTRGREVIPAGAMFHGMLTKAEVTDTNGTTEVMLLTFEQVNFGGDSYSLQSRTDSVGVRTAAGDIGLDEAAKVGAGAALGALAGHLIGGNKTGVIVGAAAGTAAGVGIAMATRGEKVMLDAGAPIRLVLTAPFVRAS